MKVRNGFVSNSSSSSFCIYGAYFDSFSEFADAFGLEEVPYNIWSIDTKGLEIWEISDCGSSRPSIFIGRRWSSIKDDETGAEFKESVEQKFVGTDKKICRTHEEAWYNG